MAKRDFYETLGVSKTASDADLKSAFRKAAMQCHPDRHPGDKQAEARFKELNEAYQHLSDAQKRAAYDRYGHAAFDQSGMNDGFAASMSDIFDDLFGDMMGGRRGRQSSGRERGADLRYNLEISLEEAFRGKTASIRMPTSVACEACAGSGARAGSKPITCKTCGGHGRVRAQQGFFAIERTCPSCHGRGQTIENPCDKCAGAGRVTRERTLSVNVPAGVEDGTRIRLTGEGEAGMRGGPPGDLYIFLTVKPHAIFQRDGADLYCRVPISMVQAALGGEFTVTTLDGTEFEGQRSRGRAVRPPIEAARQGHAGFALARFGGSVRSAQCRDAAKPHPAPARAFDRVRRRVLAPDPPRKRGLLRQDEGVLRGAGLSRLCQAGRAPI